MPCLPLGRAQVAEGAVQAAGVVPALDVVEDGPAKFGDAAPGPGGDQLSFDGGEEGFRDGVVVGTTGQPQRQPDAICPGQSGKVLACVLTSAVRINPKSA